MTLVILFLIAAALFGLSFVTRRRFGVLGLGLAAGSLLAQSLTSTVSPYTAATVGSLGPFSPASLTVIVLTLLPVFALLMGGPRYTDTRATVMGSIAFGLLGLVLLIGPLSNDLPMTDPTVKQALDEVAKWQHWIVAVGIGLAVVDTLLTRSGKSGRKHEKK